VLDKSPDYPSEIKQVLIDKYPAIQYIITSCIDMGTDIQPYFLTLHNLTTKYPAICIDYILKLHTKSDVPTMTTMLDTFQGIKLDKAISFLDNPAHEFSKYDIIGAKDLIMPNYHVKDLLTRIYKDNHNKFLFVAGSSFLSRFNIQHDILKKYSNTTGSLPNLIKQSLFCCQYYTGWLFDKNSPAHALERIIGGFESQTNDKQIAGI
jgi:hypothetical protein